MRSNTEFTYAGDTVSGVHAWGIEFAPVRREPRFPWLADVALRLELKRLQCMHIIMQSMPKGADHRHRARSDEEPIRHNIPPMSELGSCYRDREL